MRRAEPKWFTNLAEAIECAESKAAEFIHPYALYQFREKIKIKQYKYRNEFMLNPMCIIHVSGAYGVLKPARSSKYAK